MKYEKSNLIHIQTKDNLVILTYKIDTLIVLTTFLKKCEEKKKQKGLYIGTDGVYIIETRGTCLSFRSFIALARIDYNNIFYCADAYRL